MFRLSPGLVPTGNPAKIVALTAPRPILSGSANIPC